jgi:hypothetical protein
MHQPHMTARIALTRLYFHLSHNSSDHTTAAHGYVVASDDTQTRDRERGGLARADLFLHLCARLAGSLVEAEGAAARARFQGC